MAFNKGKQSREAEQIPKSRLSSDCRLQLACMKLELLVIVDQHATVNTFPGLVHTARQTMRVGNARSLLSNRKREGAAEGGSDNWGVGGVAHLGERLPCKQEVSGSIPLISTKYLRRSEPRKYGPIAQLARAHD